MGERALVVSLQHVLGQALQQRRAGPRGADAAGAALDAQVLQHERLQVVRDLRQRLDRLREEGNTQSVIMSGNVAATAIGSVSEILRRDNVYHSPSAAEFASGAAACRVCW